MWGHTNSLTHHCEFVCVCVWGHMWVSMCVLKRERACVRESDWGVCKRERESCHHMTLTEPSWEANCCKGRDTERGKEKRNEWIEEKLTSRRRTDKPTEEWKRPPAARRKLKGKALSLLVADYPLPSWIRIKGSVRSLCCRHAYSSSVWLLHVIDVTLHS